jgi:Cytochrome c
MKIWTAAIAMAAISGVSHSGNLCSINPYTKADAEQGKTAFNSHCALCHQYSMTGREPGNYKNESPDINMLSESDLRFLDHGGGVVPPLVGDKFFAKWQGKSLVDFSSTVSSASNSFPTTDFGNPKTYFLIAAYVLYRNCGKM